MLHQDKRFNEDITLKCQDCGHDFVFSRGEQEFYFSKALSTPKRCPDCRRQRKNSINRAAEVVAKW